MENKNIFVGMGFIITGIMIKIIQWSVYPLYLESNETYQEIPEWQYAIYVISVIAVIIFIIKLIKKLAEPLKVL